MFAFSMLLAQYQQRNSADDSTAVIVSILGLACVGLISLVLYFLPFIVAGMRGHQNTAAIFVLTLLLGWTGIGWIVALVWAFTAVERPRYRSYYYDD
jgi:hypothetical protein